MIVFILGTSPKVPVIFGNPISCLLPSSSWLLVGTEGKDKKMQCTLVLLGDYIGATNDRDSFLHSMPKTIKRQVFRSQLHIALAY